jgi:hypothetical protein
MKKAFGRKRAHGAPHRARVRVLAGGEAEVAMREVDGVTREPRLDPWAWNERALGCG